MSRNNKKFHEIDEDFSVRLVEPMGYCFASDRITVDGEKVGYMYREEPDSDEDSGWRFFAGDEDDEYVNDVSKVDIYDVNTIAHYDHDIIELLDAPYETAYGRGEEGAFEEESFESPDEE